ncbi:MAG: hypothetical protein ABIR94_00495 [Rubrivivax sp.]
MHLVVSHAACSAGRHALDTLSLPHLERLLARMSAVADVEPGDAALNLPHEHLLAQARGWPDRDGLLPFGAHFAREDGIDVSDESLGWGLVTPCHWQLGRDEISLLDPAVLALDEHESRALCQAVGSLFDSDGWSLAWGAPRRWYASHPSLKSLPTASLDRVVGQAIDDWLPDRRQAAHLRRLQAEVQMLLYTHPINDGRECRGELPVNSFWISGTGPTAVAAPLPDGMVFDDCLRGPALAQDWAAWTQAWHDLDAGPIAALGADATGAGRSSLSLCGSTRAWRFDSTPRSTWQRLTQRWSRVDVLPLLQSLCAP